MVALRAKCFHEMVSPSEPLCGFIFPPTWETDELAYLRISLGEQVRVLDWPVDFLVGTVNIHEQKFYAVVECDGHDFHERTKAQAARDRQRDRRLQDAGFRVFRFTGSELFNKPMACADEVYAWASRIWDMGLPE